MWIYTKHGFFSIVQDKDDENYLLVRARVNGDIEEFTKTLPFEITIGEDQGSDYRYRCRLERHWASKLIESETMDIDYTNFKAAVGAEDKRRSEYYGMVWAIMCDMQDHFLDESRKEEE